ncbi:MAG TPA: TonB family protein [Pedobacter sp.]|nr:TonB family protein [Pedobacter sp.]
MAKILFALLLLYTTGLRAQPSLKEGLENFVIKNQIYPLYSLQNCIEGSVTIGFKLNQKGEVYDSQVRTGVGTDLDDEALRLIRMSSGKWTVPDGHDTSIVIIAPINFRLSGYDCANKSRQEIQEAIRTYQSNIGLTNAVLNFYKNKASGKFTKEEEQKIIALKNSLGYDNEYLTDRINEGKKKLKQKDKQGACEDFLFVKHMGSDLADELLAEYCN